MCDSHTGKVQAMHLTPRATCFTVHVSESTGSGSSQLMGGVPPVPEAQEGAVE